MGQRMIQPFRWAFLALTIAAGGCAAGNSGLETIFGERVGSAERSADSPYESGKAHFAAGRYGLAVASFKEALAQTPDSVDNLNALAAAYDQLGRFDQSELLYLRALRLAPSSGHTLNNLGYSYRLQRHYDLALTYLREALRNDPANVRVYHNLMQAEAGWDLAGRAFVTSPMVGRDEATVTRPTRTLVMRAPRSSEGRTLAGASGKMPPVLVTIRAPAARPSLWIERTTPSVQTLVTRPSNVILGRAREAGVPPRLASHHRAASGAKDEGITGTYLASEGLREGRADGSAPQGMTGNGRE